MAKEGMCSYCGNTTVVTRDHVIPECMFHRDDRPKPHEYIVIPACEACNTAVKSSNDSYLRDVLVSDIACSGNAAAQKLSDTVVFKSMKRKSSDFRKDFDANDFYVEYEAYPLGPVGYGYYVEYEVVSMLDLGRMNQSLSTIARGLYFYVRRQRVPETCRFRVRRLSEDESLMVVAKLGVPAWTKEIGHGEEFAGYGWISFAEYTSWLLIFYGGVIVEVMTAPMDDASTMTSQWGAYPIHHDVVEPPA